MGPSLPSAALRCRSHVQAGDSSAEELAQATQLTGALMPAVRSVAPLEMVEVSAELQEARAYGKLRIERTNARLEGKRKKRAQEAEKEAKDTKA